MTTRDSPYVFAFGGRVVCDRSIGERWQPCVDAVRTVLDEGEIAYPQLRARLVPGDMSETDLRCVLATSAIGSMEVSVPDGPDGSGQWDLMAFRLAETA